MINNSVLKWAVEIFLIVIIPISTLGFEFLDDTGITDKILGLAFAKNAVVRSLVSQGSLEMEKFITPDQVPQDFSNAWKLIKNNTKADLPDTEPAYITRMGIQNSPYITIKGV